MIKKKIIIIGKCLYISTFWVGISSIFTIFIVILYVRAYICSGVSRVGAQSSTSDFVKFSSPYLFDENSLRQGEENITKLTVSIASGHTPWLRYPGYISHSLLLFLTGIFLIVLVPHSSFLVFVCVSEHNGNQKVFWTD